MARRAFILGGSGQIGQAMARRLLEDGWQITSGQRDAASLPEDLRRRGVTPVLLDREDTAALTQALAGGYDVAIDTVAYTGGHARQWQTLQSKVGALAVISTGSVYADDEGRTLDEARVTGTPAYPIPIREDQRRAKPGDATYSTRKVEMEDALLEGLRIPLTILRPFAIHGPGSRAPREWWFLNPILRGARTIPLAYNGKSRFHTSATANIAELARVALETGGTHVLNAADPHALTVAEIGETILAAMGSDAVLAPFDGPPKSFRGASPWSVAAPLVADMSAAQALGYRPVTDYAAAAKATCEALVAAAQASDWRTAFPGLLEYPEGFFD